MTLRISDKIIEWLTNEKNQIRILKYWWIISTIRVAIGVILFLIIVFGIFQIEHYR